MTTPLEARAHYLHDLTRLLLERARKARAERDAAPASRCVAADATHAATGPRVRDSARGAGARRDRSGARPALIESARGALRRGKRAGVVLSPPFAGSSEASARDPSTSPSAMRRTTGSASRRAASRASLVSFRSGNSRTRTRSASRRAPGEPSNIAMRASRGTASSRDAFSRSSRINTAARMAASRSSADVRPLITSLPFFSVRARFCHARSIRTRIDSSKSARTADPGPSSQKSESKTSSPVRTPGGAGHPRL